MKKMTQLASAIVLTASGLGLSATAQADISYNAGWASEYYWRGFYLGDGTASAGVDYTEGGFYLGAWTADLSDGLEIDAYLGYGLEINDNLSVSVGYTGYYYTGDGGDTTEEINFGLSLKAFTLNYAQGTYDNFGMGDVDYNYLDASFEYNNFHLTFGTWGDDIDGDYIEFGYDFTAVDLDFGVDLIINSKELNGWSEEYYFIDDDQALVFSIGKTW